MRKTSIIILLVAALLAILTIAATRGNIYSTRAVMALSQLIDSQGKLSICLKDADNHCWISTDSTNKVLKISQGKIYFDATPSPYSIESTQNMIFYAASMSNNRYYEWKIPGGTDKMYINANGDLWLNVLTGNYISMSGYVAGSYLFHTQWIENNTTAPITLNDPDGVKVEQFTGTGNAYVCVNAQGMLYRSAVACI